MDLKQNRVQSERAEPGLLTVAETARLLRLKVSTIRAWLLRRKIPYVKLGSRVFVRRGDLENLLAASLVPARELQSSRAIDREENAA